MASLKSIQHGGSFETTGFATSYADVASAYFDLNAAGTHAQFGAKGPGSLGVKLRSLNAGALVDALVIAANGAATFIENVIMSTGKTLQAQAITGTTLVLSSSSTSPAFNSTLSNTAQILIRNAGAQNLLYLTSLNNFLGAGAASDTAIGCFGSLSFFPGNGGSVALRLNSDLSAVFGGAVGGVTTFNMSSTLTNTGGAIILGNGTGGPALTLNAGVGSLAATVYQLAGATKWQAGYAISTATRWEVYDQVNAALAISVAPGANPAVTLNGTLTLGGYGAGTGVVSVGAADSGGAGFKLLRVPN